MSNDKLISIVVPVYNAGDFLEQSLFDIIRQSYQNFELICVDDGSTDNSGKILDEYAKKDSRIKVIHQKNAGGGVARNAGLNVARGKYVVFLDADDRYEPDLLEKVYRAAEFEMADVAVYGGNSFDHLTGTYHATPWLVNENGVLSVDDPFEKINTSVWNKMFLREHLLKHNLRFQENRIVDTMSFVFLAVIYAQRFALVEKLLYHYRTNNSESIISNSDKYPLEAYEALMLIKNRLIQDNHFKEKKNIFLKYSTKYLSDRLRLMKTKKGFISLYNALHDGGIEKLGFDEVELEGSLLKEIREKTAAEYLFDSIANWRNLGFIRKNTFVLPMLEMPVAKLKVVIYGAGDCGKDYYAQVSNRNDMELVGWVDRDYKKIGFPIQSTDALVQMEYDYILIAVADEKTANNICSGLKEMGISDDKVIWKAPIIM